MWALTKQERLVLLILSFVIFIGSTLHVMRQKTPGILNFIDFIEQQRYITKIDLNKASLKQLTDIPYVGEITAERIMAFRNQNGNFQSVDQLKDVRGIGSNVFERIRPYVEVKSQKF